MNELRTENWNGYTIRFVNMNGEWMAVLKDVCDALGLITKKAHQRLSKEVLFRYPLPTNGGPQGMLHVYYKHVTPFGQDGTCVPIVRRECFSVQKNLKKG